MCRFWNTLPTSIVGISSRDSLITFYCNFFFFQPFFLLLSFYLHWHLLGPWFKILCVALCMVMVIIIIMGKCCQRDYETDKHELRYFTLLTSTQYYDFEKFQYGLLLFKKKFKKYISPSPQKIEINFCIHFVMSRFKEKLRKPFFLSFCLGNLIFKFWWRNLWVPLINV